MPSVKRTTFRSAYEMGLWLINDGGAFKPPRTFNFLTQARMRKRDELPHRPRWREENRASNREA